MKKIVSVLTIFLAGCSSMTQTVSDQDRLVSLQIIDRNDITETISSKEKLEKYQNKNFDAPQPYKQVLRLYNNQKEAKTFGKLSSYHANGNLWQTLEVADARANGLYQEWYPNGQMKAQVKVIGGPANLSDQSKEEWIFDGISSIWNEKGVLIAEIPYVKGILSGVANHYYETGEKKASLPYEKNQIHGEAIYWNLDGNLIKRIQFGKGIKSGKSESFWPKEIPSTIEIYENGNLSTGYYYTPQKELISSITNGNGTAIQFKHETIWKKTPYIRGVPHGKVEKFTKDGQLKKRYNLYHGKRQGEEVCYYTNNDSKEQPKLSFNWLDGYIHGVVKTWYPGGKVKSQHEMSKNRKTGMYLVWYKTGQVMLVEEYENDRLINGKYFKLNEKEPCSKVHKGSGTASLFDEEGILIKKITYDKGSIVE